MSLFGAYFKGKSVTLIGTKGCIFCPKLRCIYLDASGTIDLVLPKGIQLIHAWPPITMPVRNNCSFHLHN